MHLFAADIEIDTAKNLCRIEGVAYPSIGFGTYPLTGEMCTTAVSIKDDPLLTAIGNKHEKTPCQVALRWIVQQGCIPLPGSKSETHIKENFNSLNFSLSEEEMEQITVRAASGKRFRVTEDVGLGFCDEFDLSYQECWPK